MNRSLTLFPALLWKEWRDHRAALLGYFIAIPPLIAWGLTALTAAKRIDPMLPSAAAVCGLAIAALTLFGDLFAGEEQRGTIKLLRRLPSGLSKVFIGKISFALIAAVAMSGWAYLATTTAAALLYGGPFLPRISLPAVAWLPFVFPLAAWISAAAIWLSRATLALPAAALTLALFSAPIGAALWFLPGLKATKDELQIAYIILTAAGPFVAGASFVIGRRRSARSFVPALAGLVATLSLFAPAYAWTGVRVAKFLTIAPELSSFRIDPNCGAVDTNGRYAYVNVFNMSDARESRGFDNHDPDQGDSPFHPFCVDLQSGAWKELGSPGSLLFPPGQGFVRQTTSLVGLRLESTSDDLPCGQPDWRLFDATTGVAFEQDLERSLLRRSGLVSEILRGANHLRLPDGRRVWHEMDFLVADPRRMLPDSEFGNSSSMWGPPMPGFGFALDRGVVYDVLRERRFEVRTTLHVLFVRPGRWLVYDRTRSSEAWKQRLYDPETRELGDIAGLGECDVAISLASDDRLLVITNYRRPAEQEPELVLLDPESGARERVSLPETLSLRSSWVTPAGRTPDWDEILMVRNSKDLRTRFVRLTGPSAAGDTAQVRGVTTAAIDDGTFLGAADEDSLIAIESSRRLVRLRFDGSPLELLFPR